MPFGRSWHYLGTLLSSGTSLSGGFQTDWSGSWNLGPDDKFLVCDFNGGAGWDGLLVYNCTALHRHRDAARHYVAR